MKRPFETSHRRQCDPVTIEPSAEMVFVSGGLKAALNSQTPVRQGVVRDISRVLNCAQDELDFLFANSGEGDEPDIYDFPDSDRRRQVIRTNFPDAAE